MTGFLYLAQGFNIHLCYSVYLYSNTTAAKSRQLCPTLCDRIDSSPTGSSVPEILQARILEWIAISFSNSNPTYS